MTSEQNHLQQPVLAVARKDVATLRRDLTVQQALDIIRQRGIGEKIVYFYAVDTEYRLVGVLPTRRPLARARETSGLVAGLWPSPDRTDQLEPARIVPAIRQIT